MDKDQLLNEMVKWTTVARAKDPLLELDIQKAVTALKEQMKAPSEAVAAFEQALRAPEKITWKKAPPLPEEPLHWEPSDEQVQWFRDFIQKVAEGCEWELPQTGQIYKISKQNKTFTLIKDTEHDHDRWHDKTKMILGLLGWTMVDQRNSTNSFTAAVGPWALGVFDFSISTQEDSRSGELYPPGTRGQDAFLTGGSGVVHLGQRIGAELWKHTKQPDYGVGKSDAASQVVKEKYGRENS